MDRGAVLLQGLKAQLLQWVTYWKRSLHPTEILITPGEGGEFTVKMKWIYSDGREKTYEKYFSRAVVFGSSFSLSPAAWSVQKKACEYARDVVREVLEQRGV